jgi:hypothetical protein
VLALSGFNEPSFGVAHCHPFFCVKIYKILVKNAE